MRAVGSLPRAAMRLLQLSLLSLGTGEAKAAAALQVATCFVSRVMTEGWRRLSQGMLVFSSGQAFLVQACLQVDGVLAALCQRLVPQPSLSDTTSTWLMAGSELVAVPFSECTRVAKCWKKLSDGSLLALGRWRVA